MTACVIYSIPAYAFANLGSLDFFKIEKGRIDAVDGNAWLGLNVEKLSSDSHQFPRNLGRFEISYCNITTETVPIGLLYNMKNLTSAVLRVGWLLFFIIV